MAITVVQAAPKDLVDIRMKRNVVGPGGTDLYTGEEYSVAPEHAAYMIYAGQAEEIGEDVDTETAQEKYDRLQIEAATLAKQGRRRVSPQAPIEAHDGTGAVDGSDAVAGKSGAVSTIGLESKTK